MASPAPAPAPAPPAAQTTDGTATDGTVNHTLSWKGTLIFLAILSFLWWAITWPIRKAASLGVSAFKKMTSGGISSPIPW